MRLKNGFSLEKKDGQNIIVCRDNNAKFNSLIVLNETNAFLFESMTKGEKSREQLLNLLLENFDVSTVLALNDIDIFVRTLKENGVIEE